MQTILIALTIYIISWISLILLTKWVYKDDKENIPNSLIISMLIPIWNTIVLIVYLLIITIAYARAFTKRLLI